MPRFFGWFGKTGIPAKDVDAIDLEATKRMREAKDRERRTFGALADRTGHEEFARLVEERGDQVRNLDSKEADLLRSLGYL